MTRQLLKCSIIAAVLGMFFLPAFAQEEFNPYETLKEGDWVKYECVTTSGITSEITQRVTKIEGKKVIFNIFTRMFMNGRLLGESGPTTQTADFSTTQETPKHGLDKNPQVEYSTFKVKGKELKCKVTTYKTGKHVSKIWVCEDVPFGSVKIESNGNVSMELVDWGSKE